jgi:hypothetical protein
VVRAFLRIARLLAEGAHQGKAQALEHGRRVLDRVVLAQGRAAIVGAIRRIHGRVVHRREQHVGAAGGKAQAQRIGHADRHDADDILAADVDGAVVGDDADRGFAVEQAGVRRGAKRDARAAGIIEQRAFQPEACLHAAAQVFLALDAPARHLHLTGIDLGLVALRAVVGQAGQAGIDDAVHGNGRLRGGARCN